VTYLDIDIVIPKSHRSASHGRQPPTMKAYPPSKATSHEPLRIQLDGGGRESTGGTDPRQLEKLGPHTRDRIVGVLHPLRDRPGRVHRTAVLKRLDQHRQILTGCGCSFQNHPVATRDRPSSKRPTSRLRCIAWFAYDPRFKTRRTSPSVGSSSNDEGGRKSRKCWPSSPCPQYFRAR